jgi:hypothetical protein
MSDLRSWKGTPHISSHGDREGPHFSSHGDRVMTAAPGKGSDAIASPECRILTSISFCIIPRTPT